MRIFNDTIVDLTSVTASSNSEVVSLDFIYGFSAQIKWTSTTASATIKLQASNDNVSFVDIAGTTQTVNNNNGDLIVNLDNVFYKYFRAAITYTSGTVTTIKVIVNGKGI